MDHVAVQLTGRLPFYAKEDLKTLPVVPEWIPKKERKSWKGAEMMLMMHQEWVSLTWAVRFSVTYIACGGAV